MPNQRAKQTIANRTAVVTGAASGIGRALVEELSGAGVHVVLADRQVELEQEAAAGIRKRGGAATAFELDVRDAHRFRSLGDDCGPDRTPRLPV